MDSTGENSNELKQIISLYNELVWTQINMFVENDEFTAYLVFPKVVWEIPHILASSTEHLSHVGQIIQCARRISIEVLRDNPSYDQWQLWQYEPSYFTLLEKHRTQFYKEIFWYRFFRDIPEKEVAERFEISTEEVHSIMKAILLEASQGMQQFIQRYSQS